MTHQQRTHRDVKVGVSYFGVRNPRHVVEDLKAMSDAGIDFVVHTFSENDAEFYLETMKEIVELTHRFGLEAYIDPWGVAGVFGGEAYSKFVALNHDALQRYNDGQFAAAACPNNPKTLDFVKSWIRKAAEIGGDVIFFDEPHFAHARGGWSCVCDHCKRKFESIFGYEMPSVLNEDVERFRLESIRDFLKQLAGYAKEFGMRTAVCMLPRTSELHFWREIFALPELDIVGTDPYWTGIGLHGKEVYDHVLNFTKLVVELADGLGKEAQIWIQMFKIGDGDEDDIKEAVRAAVDGGARNIAAWSYMATGYMSYIRCERPDVAWSRFIESVYEIKRTENKIVEKEKGLLS